MTGLAKSVAGVESGSRVIGLDFVKISSFVRGMPFIHGASYAQVEKPLRLNFSFAQHATSLVVFEEMQVQPWTASLEWYAERVQPTDFRHFDYAVINAYDEHHRILAERFGLEALTTEGRWRLYLIPR